MKIHKSWYLKVSENHEIYYECKGSPNWIPVLFLHGWPWDCFKEKHERNFDEKIHNVIFFDQRWAGKSRVSWWDVLFENTTDFLVEDIIKILDFFELEKVNIFWRSWGSTLALIFAIRYPKKVVSMVIWWVWLSWLEPKDDFLHWNGIKNFFPDLWEEFLFSIPEKIRSDTEKVFDYIYDEMNQKNYDPLISLGLYEAKLMKLEWRRDLDEVDTSNTDFINSLKIFFHYVYNSCFISKDYILNNAHKLDNIDVSIIQWRYDSVCPAIEAYKLDKKLKKSNLYFTMWGHSSSEPETLELCKKEVKKTFL